jgi:hypothetical protein
LTFVESIESQKIAFVITFEALAIKAIGITSDSNSDPNSDDDDDDWALLEVDCTGKLVEGLLQDVEGVG